MESKHKILFISHFYPERAPSQRFRFEQYFDYFEKNGFDCNLSYLIDRETDAVFYGEGKFFKKLILLYKFFKKRIKDIKTADNYDIVFVQREAHYIGTAYIEKKLAKKSKLIFDFDDSIWLMHVSDVNKKFNWLKRPKKTNKIIEISHYVIAGNNYLADYAKKINPKTVVIPTTIDTDYHIPHKEKQNNKRVCIGWTGSMTTIRHFETIIPVLRRIQEKYGEYVYFKVIGSKNDNYKGINIICKNWELSTEIEELSEFDIGIMPLPDNDWEKGKCGLKGLQYMAMEIPAVMSPVGVNKEIIIHGENGYLCSSDNEWYDTLCMLIDNAELRKSIGKNSRKTVIEKYSKQAWKDKYIEVFNQVISDNN